MAQVTVADDVLSAQPGTVRELDVAALVERDVQELVIDHWLGDVRFVVSPLNASPAAGAEAEAQTGAVAAGVRAAAERFWLVDESGRELPDLAATEVADLHTPDQVVGPLRSDSGIVVATGTKDGVTVPMGEALVKILREELGRLDVDVHIACLPEEIELDDLMPHDTTAPDAPAQSAPRFEQSYWYVTRPVRRTGRGYGDHFLCSDSSWSPDQADAVSYAEADRAVVARLVETLPAARSDETGEVTAVLLPATTETPRPLPPPEGTSEGG